MKPICQVFGATAPRDTVFAALTAARGLPGGRATIVQAEAAAGAIAHVTFAGDVNPGTRVTAREPPAVVCRGCAGGHEPWAQSTVRFELAGNGGGATIAGFWQDCARERSDDDYGTYHFNWGHYRESLRLSSETGSGKPFQAGSATA